MDAIELLRADHEKVLRMPADLKAGSPKVRSAVDGETLAELGQKMAEAKKKAPTRPHPETPPSPRVQRIAGRMAAALDHARDALTGRGR